jgi:Na+/H+-dicarboxylate symporter
MRSRALIAVLVLFGLAALLHVVNAFGVLLPSALLIISRWLFLAALAWWAAAKRTLTAWIVFALIFGGELGHDLPVLITSPAHQKAFLDAMRVITQMFLKLIKVIIAPLLFATLVSGIAGHANLKKVGRMGVKAIVYFELVTTVALAIGLAAINISKAGVGIHLTAAADTSLQAAKPTASDVILHIFPENIAKSVAENQILQVVVFSILFGIALAMVREDKRRPMLAFTDSLSEAMFKFTNIVMLFAPFGVGSAMAYTVGHTGLGVLYNLLRLLVTLYIALFIFAFGVLLPIALMFRVPVKRFIKAVAEPASIAFATSSSEAALPRAMEAMESIGIPRQIVAFIIPTGYSFNLDGSTLYQSLGAIFVAQAAGIHMSIGQQLLMMLTLMLTSKGTAGVSRASIVILLATVGMFGLPVEPVFILLGIDQLMDMGRTAINVIGNCLATAVIARWEGEFGAALPSPAVQEAVAK